jgi:hypothetical protein
MRVYSYIVTHDSGFAPNPFHGVLTLACCKPMIRRTARVGDVVVGLSTRSERVIYAMRVAEKLSFNEYWADSRFASKIPDKTSASALVRRGDNIYQPFGIGAFRQLPSRHSHADGTEDPQSTAHDLGGRHVLVAGDFVYFGGSGPDLPEHLDFLATGRGHRCNFASEQVEAVVGWFSNQARGVLGRPCLWPSGDQSWRQGT